MMSNQPGDQTHRRPGTATAAGVLAMLCGVGVFGGSGFGALWLVWWISEAKPGESRGLGGTLGIAFALLGLFIGWIMLRGGFELLRGEPYFVMRMRGVYVTLTGMCGVGIANGLFNTDFHGDGWLPTMAGYVAVFSVLLTTVLLINNQATQRYLGLCE